MLSLAMPIRSQLQLVLAEINVERAKRGESTLSLRQLSAQTGVPLSSLSALNTNKSTRIDYSTLDRLLQFFNLYRSVGVGDLLVWKPNEE